eukprot:TRINITY_DN50050_c0_g2_i2.p1 TRINITY_DN50050_c0_g2~~TRINITY_DN50050_c0_g2_i2.p1  ORF type:complete len:136 (-),score=17.30 TRINITY_DN50050_c0_g2_i2:2-409(-)
MAKMVLSALLLSICAVSVCHGWWNRCSPFWSPADVNHCTPCNLFRPKQVTLHVRNVLIAPTFQESITLNCTHSKTLFSMMMEAAESNSLFRFSVKYYGVKLGFLIEAINGQASFISNQTWWQILDGNKKLTLVGR